MTHDQSEMKSLPVIRLEEVENAAWHVDVIAIDEGQFLPGMWGLPKCGLGQPEYFNPV